MVAGLNNSFAWSDPYVCLECGGALGSWNLQFPVADGPGACRMVWRGLTARKRGQWIVKVVGNSFRVGSASWYPFGINYFPLNSINPPGGPPFFAIPAAEHWFLPDVYDECATEADLALLESLGMNMVRGRPAP